MIEFKYIKSFTILFTLSCIVIGCANSDLEFYSAEPDFMTCFRKEIKGSKAQISLAIEGEESRVHIPLIYRSLKIHSPYSVKFVLNTDELLYSSVLVSNATLKNEAGEIFPLMEEGRTISLKFYHEKYSGYAQKEAFQADSIFPSKPIIEYRNNGKITIAVDFSLISKSKNEKQSVVAIFYAKHKKWFGSIFPTYTN